MFRRLPFLDLRAWRPSDLLPDLGAAAAVTVLSIPQGLAYAVMAGLPPAVGLYASVLPAILGGFFRSSRYVVAGPTNALSLLVGTAVAGVAHQVGAPRTELALTLALMVGIIQFIAGILRLGAFVDYISNAVVLGYITGAAVLIGIGQLPSLTNTSMTNLHGHSDVFSHLMTWGQGLGQADPRSLAVGLSTLAGIVLLRRMDPRIPGSLIAMLVGIGVTTFFPWDGLRTIGDIAAVPASLPPWTVPSLAHTGALVPAAVAATVLSLVESSSVARAIATRTGERVDPSAEFTGQGLANLAAAFSGGYPVSGSLGRSVANWRAGARSRLAGPLGAGMVAVVVLLAGSYVDRTPMASLAGILIILAWDLIDFHRIRVMIRGGAGDVAAFLATLIGAWVLELDKAIYLGVVISIVLFLRRARLLTVTELAVDDRDRLREVPDTPGGADFEAGDFRHCSHIRVLHVEGSLFFGAASELAENLEDVLSDLNVRVLVLRLKRCQGLDVTTAEVLGATAEALKSGGRQLILVGMRPRVMERMEAMGLVHSIGRENLFPTEPGWFVAMDHALEHALSLVPAHPEPDDCPIERYLQARKGMQ